MQHDVRAYIGGEWVSCPQLGQNSNPAHRNDVIGSYPLLSAAHARAAVAAAVAALPRWRATPAPERARFVTAALDLLKQRRLELTAIITREQGKTRTEATLEIDKAIEVLNFIAGEGLRADGQTLASAVPGRHVFTIRQPLGVVALITPWNFPVSIPLWKLAPALVAGNTVVLKPASMTPWCAEAVVRLFVDAGIPKGVVNLLTGDGPTAGAALVAAPGVRGVSFTGSTAVGLQINAAAARRGLKVQCEMGGKNPLIVLDDADIEAAAIAVTTGAFGAAGQRCTATSRAIVVDSVADAFVDRVRTLTAGIVVGDGADAATTMGPLACEEALQQVLEYVDLARAEGARLVAGGQRLSEGALGNGHFMAPTIFDHVRPDMRIAREEIFGPVLCVLRVRDFETAVRVANDSELGLCASVFSNDIRRIFAFVERIETGIAHVNGPNTSGEAHLPFGGIKASGVGTRELGHAALDFYTETKTVYMHIADGTPAPPTSAAHGAAVPRSPPA